jgi:hypothetical protein
MHSVHVPLKTRPELLAEEQARVAALPPPAGPREVAEGDRKARAVQDHPVYAGMIREMDETVATVLAAVEAAGQTDNTLVVFTSDNGGLSTAEGSPTSNLPLRAGKGFLYEGGIRVPLVVRWPGVVKPGTTNDVPVTTLDIAATLLDVGGAKLPAETLAGFDVSSMRYAIHAAAPCPIDVKEKMIAWWGPIIHEYYAGTEGNGFCYIGSADWLNHKGSVGKAVMGELRICNEEGDPLPPRQEGQVYFENGPPINYHNDPAKTAEAHREPGMFTLGDVGYLDDEGYLFLSDRKIDMIISGGVNIYPAEIEGVLGGHPAVVDVAVFGVPDEEFGEQVKAALQLADGLAWGPEVEASITALAREKLAGYKVPRSFDVVDTMPRSEAGKLLKRQLRAPYWQGQGRSI